jgi:hypothetical protein
VAAERDFTTTAFQKELVKFADTEVGELQTTAAAVTVSSSLMRNSTASGGDRQTVAAAAAAAQSSATWRFAMTVALSCLGFELCALQLMSSRFQGVLQHWHFYRHMAAESQQQSLTCCMYIWCCTAGVHHQGWP